MTMSVLLQEAQRAAHWVSDAQLIISYIHQKKKKIGYYLEI